MGIDPAHAIVTQCACNIDPIRKHREVVRFEGDSAFGLSKAEVETMARYDMDIPMFVINNGGTHYGDSEDSDDWLKPKEITWAGKPGGLRSASLGCEVSYE